MVNFNLAASISLFACLTVLDRVVKKLCTCLLYTSIHNSKDFAVSMNGVKVEQDGARNLGEIKLGVNGNLNPAASVWGNAVSYTHLDVYKRQAYAREITGWLLHHVAGQRGRPSSPVQSSAEQLRSFPV